MITKNKLEFIVNRLNKKNLKLNDLNNIKCSFRKVPGNYYYVYKNDNEKYLSLISPDEWNKKEDFSANNISSEWLKENGW